MDGIFYSSLTEGDFDPTAALRQSLTEGDFAAPGFATATAAADFGGRYAIANSGYYALYVGVDAEPDLTAAPTTTFASLPHATALAAGHTYYLVTRYVSAYGLESQNAESAVVIVAGDGSETPAPPSGPATVALAAAAAGTMVVTAVYYFGADADPADTWLIYLTDSGVDPDPELDSPTTVAMTATRGAAVLSWTSSAAADDADVRVLVRTRRTGPPVSDSTNITATAATADATAPDAPTVSALAAGFQEHDA